MSVVVAGPSRMDAPLTLTTVDATVDDARTTEVVRPPRLTTDAAESAMVAEVTGPPKEIALDDRHRHTLASERLIVELTNAPAT